MKKWKAVKRLTLSQKEEILKRAGERYELVRHFNGVYMFLGRADGKLSDYILRRCPHCGYIDIWFLMHQYAAICCMECREFGEAS